MFRFLSTSFPFLYSYCLYNSHHPSLLSHSVYQYRFLQGDAGICCRTYIIHSSFRTHCLLFYMYWDPVVLWNTPCPSCCWRYYNLFCRWHTGSMPGNMVTKTGLYLHILYWSYGNTYLLCIRILPLHYQILCWNTEHHMSPWRKWRHYI